ncbi:MAG TPA: hypothetical protein VK148_14295, partial [Xanthobacteraceae bacterium]|nr:hypothetical protein [Xanthobacteraceae bacterium]
QAQQARDITGAFGGNANDVDRCCAHALPLRYLQADEKIWQAIPGASGRGNVFDRIKVGLANEPFLNIASIT